MTRRQLMERMGMGTAALALGAGVASADDPHDHDESEHHAHSEHMETMGECAILCNETAHHCLSMIRDGKGEAKAHAKVHEFAMDCQAFCVLSVTLMARHSPLSKHAHMATAEACAACAEACEGHKDGGEIVARCAEMCRKCEKVCRDAAAGHGEQ